MPPAGHVEREGSESRAPRPRFRPPLIGTAGAEDESGGAEPGSIMYGRAAPGSTSSGVQVHETRTTVLMFHL